MDNNTKQFLSEIKQAADAILNADYYYSRMIGSDSDTFTQGIDDVVMNSDIASLLTGDFQDLGYALKDMYNDLKAYFDSKEGGEE